jgi:hypothetical protein
MATTDPEVPEADAIEQSQEVSPTDEEDEETPLQGPASMEVPEADALEQSQPVPGDQDERR